MEQVILVNSRDEQTGIAEKLVTHTEGLLHRAFSVFVFDTQGRVLIQKRATQKYHSGGLLSNTACGHPRPGESVLEAAHRRLKEEMGFDCPLHELSVFQYRADIADLVEHEFDHIVIGFWDGTPEVNPEEVMDWRWTSWRELKKLSKTGDATAWLKPAVSKLGQVYKPELYTVVDDRVIAELPSKQYRRIGEETTSELNARFSSFVQRHPYFKNVESAYTNKPIHLNGIQFRAAFEAVGSAKDWRYYWMVPAAIELVMLWAYKTNRIIDHKQDVWDDPAMVKTTALEHDMLLVVIYELLEESKKVLGEKHQRFYELIVECLSGAVGFQIERETLSVGFSSLEEILVDWEENYTKRNILFNLVYDYAPLAGYWLASDDDSVFDRYRTEIPDSQRCSHVGQIVNDLGDWCFHTDTTVRSYQDQFSDTRNGIVTFPVRRLLEHEEIRKGLGNPSVVVDPAWRETAFELLKTSSVASEVQAMGLASYRAIAQFWFKVLGRDDRFLLRSYSVLKGNKFFHELLSR